MTDQIKDRVLIVGSVTDGFRIHGPFASTQEASEYFKRHRDRMSPDGYNNDALHLTIMNLDTMSEEEVEDYEDEVGTGWSNQRGGFFVRMP